MNLGEEMEEKGLEKAGVHGKILELKSTLNNLN